MAKILSCALSIVSLLVPIAGLAHLREPRPQSALPPEFERVIETVVRLTAAERKQLLSALPVTKFLDADGSREVAVFGATWIGASPALYIRAVEDIENFERGGAFRITRRISSPPTLEDFARMKLSDQDFNDLKSCRLGDCEVKLGEDSLRRIRAEIDWKSPAARAQADALFRSLALDYVNGYLHGGNAELAVYRDKAKPRFVETEFRSMIDRMPALGSSLPGLRRYLLEFPNVPRAGVTDVLYWQETAFGLKPTIRISHLIIDGNGDVPVVASKMLYASHYFWTALELRALVPDPARGPGFWFVTVNRSRSDGLSGFAGRFVRGRVRNEVQKGSLSALTATKTKLEALQR